MARKRRFQAWWMVEAVMILIVVAIAVWGSIKVQVQEENEVAECVFEDRGVARMNIELNGVSLEEINGGDKDIRYGGSGLTVCSDRTVADYGEIEIKGRGNSTWQQEKKPYQIKFSEKVDLLGLGKAKKWILLANVVDESNIRNETALYLAGMLGMKYALDGEFIELYVDSDYQGLYYLTHAVEINKYSVDLRNPFGILVELDNIHNSRERCYRTGDGDILTIKDVVNNNNKDESIDNFLQQYNQLEIAVEEGDFERIKEIADIESLAQYYLLSEFTVNPDAYTTSFFMYKDGPGDKIHVGPGWDFDFSLGNRNWGNWLGERMHSPTETMIRREEIKTEDFYRENDILDAYNESLIISRIMFNLMEIPEFQEKVKDVFRDRMSGREEELVRKIRIAADGIEMAARQNNQRWSIKNSSDELEYLVDWVRKRYEYFEREYGDGGEKNQLFL